MPTRHQHYVPRVYLKAWETQVETCKEPNNKFQGVYVFQNSDTVGDGHNIESILWQPHLYTISFRQLYMAVKCPLVYSFFVNAVYDIMKNNKPKPVYGKYGYSIIKTKNSVRKYLMKIDNWDFYYEDGNIAKKKSLLNRINDIRCYILEEAFSEQFESQWDDIKTAFINGVKNGTCIDINRSERHIPEKAAKDMLEFFFMMLCRSPKFNANGVYTWIQDILLSAFDASNEINEMMDSIWFTELYRIFYKKSGGFYHSILLETLSKCQLTLFEAYDDAELFITSDIPAFQHKSMIEYKNSNGFYFPLSPKYLLLVCKGNDNISNINYRFADIDTVHYFNRIIRQNSHNTFIGVKKNLACMI